MSQTYPSFLKAKLQLSVEINGVWIPFNRALDSLGRHVYPLLHYIQNESGFDLGYAGSSLLVQHKGQLLQIFSDHQLKNIGINPSDVLVHRDELSEKKALGPAEVLTPTVDTPQHVNLNDIKIVRYESPNSPDQLKSRFLQNSLLGMSTLLDTPAERVEILFTTGFPSDLSEMDFEFDQATGEVANVYVHSRSAKLYFQLAEPIGVDPPNRTTVEIHEKLKLGHGTDFNGYSGAPVFFLWMDSGKVPHIGFAGMIVEVSFNRFHLFPGKIIQNILEDI